MNREEIISQLKLIQAGLTQDDSKKSKNRIDLVIEELEKPMSLAEFLGWEEDIEYELWSDRYKIIDNKLYLFDYKLNKWKTSCYNDDFADFKQAKRIEKYNLILKSGYIKLFDLQDYEKYLTINIQDRDVFHSKYSTDNSKYQAQFSLEEIEQIKKKYEIDLCIYEIVEVQE